MTVSRRQALHLLASGAVLSVAGCQSPSGQDNGSLALSIENDDTEAHTVWMQIRKDSGEVVERLDMVSIPAGSSFQFEGKRYRSDTYTIRVEVNQSESLAHEWNRNSCHELLQLVVTIDSDGRPQKEVDCP